MIFIDLKENDDDVLVLQKNERINLTIADRVVKARGGCLERRNEYRSVPRSLRVQWRGYRWPFMLTEGL